MWEVVCYATIRNAGVSYFALFECVLEDIVVQMIGRISIFALLLSVCLVQPVLAQIAPGVQQSAAQTATITGAVIQSDGTPVGGADVRLNGPNAHLTTVSDVHGAFIFTSVPYGTYNIDAGAANFGVASRSGIVVKGDINIAIQYVMQNTSGFKEIARVSTRSSGAQINVTPASVASITPAQYAFQGNLSWRELLNQVPGVTVGGALSGGNDTNDVIPDSPFQPIMLSINGALPYETSTTFDGMPLSNYTFAASSPGNGVDLSVLPMPLFETADIVRGPGANAPSIIDSVGGSFVLHAPGAVENDSFEGSVSNDPYGGYYSNMKATFRRGKLSGTVVYGFDTSPGPFGSGPLFGGLSPATINGNTVASGGYVQDVTNPVYGDCYCIYQYTLLGHGGYQSTAWSQHNGGIGLSYQMTPSITVQAFYAGSQATAAQASFEDTYLFTPDASYAGSLEPGASYIARSFGVSPILESGSLLEEKVTAYLGRGVLRLAALQNYTYTNHIISPTPPSTIQLNGTGTYCANPLCTTTTPFVFTGQTATVTCNYFSFLENTRSTNDDLLASYEVQVGSKSNLGISFVKSANSGTNFYNDSFIFGGITYNFDGGQPAVTETIDEFRLHAGTQLSDTLSLDGSYYFARADYHVPDPNNNNHWVDSIFSYSAPRLGMTWRMNRDAVVRAAAGGGFALPPLFNLVGSNGAIGCNVGLSCMVSLTNINLQPEKSFGFDIGTDVRLRHDTVLSADVYRTDLYGQLFQSVNLVGLYPTLGIYYHLPIYAQEYLNLGHSRFEGLNVSLRHDVPRGIYWNAGLGLTRGYIVSVPAGFYNQAGAMCNFSTGASCQNTYALLNSNFDGEFQSTVPYANGSATFGYRWAAKKYVDIQANYQGNNNAYFQPGFMEFDGHASYPLTKDFALIATFRNITGIHDQNYQFYTVNPNLIAPSVAGLEFPLYPIPYGPRTLVVTANLQL